MGGLGPLMGGLGPLMNGSAISAIDGWAVLTYGSEQCLIVEAGFGFCEEGVVGPRVRPFW